MLESLTALYANFGFEQLAMIWLIVIFASIMRAFTGFGFALVAVPGLSLLMAPTQAVVLCVMLVLAVSLATLKTFWGQAPLKPMLPMIVLSLCGTVIGSAVLGSISSESFQLWVGMAVIGACLLLTFYRPSGLRDSPGLGIVVGMVSGLMNGAMGIPGPPVVVYAVATQSGPQSTRAMLMTFFLFSCVFGLGSFMMAGYVGAGSLWLFALVFPAMYFGDKLGYWLFRRFGTTLYRRIAVSVLFLVGFVITGRALLAL